MIHRKTGRKTEELYSRYWSSILVIIFAVSVYPEPSGQVWKTETVEDFETAVYSEKDLKVRQDAEVLPDIRVSSTLTSPLLDSGKSLLIRITDYIESPVELLLKKKYECPDYLGSLIFHVYSSGSDAVLLMGLLDSDNNYRRIKISSMNFQGWRKIRVNIKSKLPQDDIIFNRHEVITLQSIYIHMGSTGKNLKEAIIILDDIQAETRKKYRVADELRRLTY